MPIYPTLYKSLISIFIKHGKRHIPCHYFFSKCNEEDAPEPIVKTEENDDFWKPRPIRKEDRYQEQGLWNMPVFSQHIPTPFLYNS